jgi:hypothetical protein
MTLSKKWGFLFLSVVLVAGGAPGMRAQEALPAPSKPPATLADFAWLVGEWRGKLQGPRALVTEQYWAEPQAGVMMGMFRLSDPAAGNRPLILEFISFRETPEGVEMRMRHFDTALKPMEKEEPLLLLLRESDGTRFVFENPVNNVPKRSIVTRVGENGYTGRSEIIRESGELALIETVWERVNARESRPAAPKKP